MHHSIFLVINDPDEAKQIRYLTVNINTCICILNLFHYNKILIFIIMTLILQVNNNPIKPVLNLFFTYNN